MEKKNKTQILQLVNAMEAFTKNTATKEQTALLKKAGRIRRDKGFGGWTLASTIKELSALLGTQPVSTRRECRFNGIPISDDVYLGEQIAEITGFTKAPMEEGRHTKYEISVRDYQRQKTRGSDLV